MCIAESDTESRRKIKEAFQCVEIVSALQTVVAPAPRVPVRRANKPNPNPNPNPETSLPYIEEHPGEFTWPYMFVI